MLAQDMGLIGMGGGAAAAPPGEPTCRLGIDGGIEFRLILSGMVEYLMHTEWPLISPKYE